MNGTLGKSLRFSVAAARVLGWVSVTLWFGVTGLIGALRFLSRMPQGFATAWPCPRGHRVELYGTFRCRRCRAAWEGRAFDPCDVCGTRPTHLDCDRCGLAVKDPQP